MERASGKTKALPSGEATSTGHSIAHSRSMTRRMMEVLDSNSQGNVHGGVIMRMVDDAAAIVAIKHSRSMVVTARVDRFDFWAPAYIGDVVTIECALDYVGRTSMEVGVRVTAESLISGEQRIVASSQVIYVAVDEQGRPKPVPRLIPADAEEQQIVERARERRERLQASEPARENRP